VVTEYVWSAGTCDPCPAPPLDRATVGVLGGDLLGMTDPRKYVVTRLHYRHRKGDPAADLELR
jgi:hypothetical protein